MERVAGGGCFEPIIFSFPNKKEDFFAFRLSLSLSPFEKGERGEERREFSHHLKLLAKKG